jgi:hypothetical protein
MLGPGFTTDASRADLVNFRALSERVGYWIGIDSRWPRWVKARRARQVLRVFGDQLTVTIHRHRVVAAHMVSLSAASAGPVLEVQTWNYKYYPKSYGLFDPSYRSLLTLLFDASKTKEFGAMGQGTEQLESFERSLEAADWPEELRQEWRA